MVELHGAHGYLITEFFSRHANKRTDAYGGSLYKRMKFGLEVIEAVRNQVGKDYPLGIRISGTDYDEKGITLDESIAFAKELANELQERGYEVYVAGDCVEIGTIYEAIHAGHLTGRQI